MSVANQNVFQIYEADGIETDFAITCAFMPQEASNQIEVYDIDPNNGTMTLLQEGALVDYTLDPPYNATTNPLGPTTVIFNTAPVDTRLIYVGRKSDLEQGLSLAPQVGIPPKSLEAQLDRLLLMIQEVNKKAEAAIRMNPIDQANAVNSILEKLTPGFAVVVSDDGTTFELLDTDTLIGPAGATGPAGADGADGTGGVPAGGLVGEFIEKLTLTEGDAGWKSATYSGVSRFGAVNVIGLKAALDYLMGITRQLPSVTLSMAGGSGTIRERGDPVASSMMTATVTMGTDPIANVRFYQGATLLDTQTGNPPVPSGGAATYNYTTAFSITTSFTAQTVDDGATGGPSNATSNTVTWTFVYPYYWGTHTTALPDGDIVANLTKVLASAQKPSALTFTSPGGEKPYVIYPLAAGAYTSIRDVLNFETIGDWTRTTISITGLDGNPVNYYRYEFNNLLIAGTYDYTFS